MYAERLSLPWWWWAIAAAFVLFGGSEVWAGFDWRVAVVVYAALGIPTFLLLLAMGRGRIALDDEGLHAGACTLSLDEVSAARVLDERETRLRLGPGGDPRAHVFMRGWVKEAVEVTPSRDDEVPYWLVSTRDPDRLVTALRDAVMQQRA